MPPSVAPSQLPMHSAHATKEPPQTGAATAFLDGCCTNNTRVTRKLFHKPLSKMDFLEKADLLSRALRRAPTSLFCYLDRCIRKRILRASDARTAPLQPRPDHFVAALSIEATRAADSMMSAGGAGRDGAGVAFSPRSRRTPARARRAFSGRPYSLYLWLAARPRLGHIDRNGDVAEWLKAAVC